MFGFPKVDPSIKDTFKRNFLRNVSFQIRFNETENFIDNKHKIHTSFEAKYPRFNDIVSNQLEIQIDKNETPILNTTKGKGFTLRSNDGNKTINFTTKSIEIIINGNGYKNFKDIIDYELNKILEILSQNKILDVNRVAVRKVNIIGLLVNENTNLSQISKNLLNDRISYCLDSFPMEEFINQNINNINYVNDKNGLNIKIGNTLQPNNSKIGHVICDIDRYYTDNCDTNSLIPIFNKINDEIFDVFMWTLSDEAKNLLTK